MSNVELRREKLCDKREKKNQLQMNANQHGFDFSFQIRTGPPSFAAGVICFQFTRRLPNRIYRRLVAVRAKELNKNSSG
jgi:hypothetical protein